MIESLFRITNRDRQAWDAETLLMLAIARDSMAHKAIKKDCEQPYMPDVSTEDIESRTESAVGSFFKRFKEQ